MMKMTFEEATAMIKLDAERNGEQRGIEIGKKQGISEIAKNLLKRN